MKNVGFLSFGHYQAVPGSQTRTASDVLLQSIDLAVAAEELGLDGAYFRVHHFARQLASPFPLLAAVGARTSRIEIGTGVIDMRYENPLWKDRHMNEATGTEATRAVIYVRLSDSREGNTDNVDDQLSGARAVADARGWLVTHEYNDNNKTAADPSKKRRPAFDQMLTDAAAGKFDKLVIRTLDRLYRHPADLQRISDILGPQGITIHQEWNEEGAINLENEQAVLHAGIGAQVSLYELRIKSKRQKATNSRKLRDGIAHGGIAGFGYRMERVDGNYQLVQVPDEAKLIQEAVRLILLPQQDADHRKPYAIMGTWNDAGWRTRRGNPWTPGAFKTTLLKATNAACRDIDGKLVEGGKWEPILTVADLQNLRDHMNNPKRLTHQGTARKHLLGGLATCGSCGEKMRVSHNRTYGLQIQCPGIINRCRRSVDMHIAEEKILEHVMIRLAHPTDDMLQATAQDRDRVQAITARLADLEEDDRTTASMKASGEAKRIMLEQSYEEQVNLQGELADLERRMALGGLLADLGDGDTMAEYLIRVGKIKNKFDKLNLDRQRAVINALVHITIAPSQPGLRASKHTAWDRIQVQDKTKAGPIPEGTDPAKG